MNNRQELTFRIEKVKLKGALKPFEKHVKDKMLHYYTITKCKELEALERSKIIEFDFETVLNRAAQRQHRLQMLENMVISLERHKYSPEQNCLHFKSGKTYPVNGLTNITDAKMYAAIHMSYADIDNYKHDITKHFRNG